MGFKGALLTFLFGLSIYIFAEELDVGVIQITDPMTVCHCENPGHVGRICITIHKWRTELYLSHEALATKFIPSIKNNEFVLFSEAFYGKCMYGLTQYTYADPVLQAKENAKGPSFQSYSYRGKEPVMKATVFDLMGNSLAHSDFVKGQFYYQEFIFNKDQPNEFMRVFYPGHTTIRFPIDKILTKEEIRNILDKNRNEYKNIKSILAVNTFENDSKPFGEFIVSLRFQRKKEVTPADVQKDPWNTNFITIEVADSEK